jgi:hypothetical protein
VLDWKVLVNERIGEIRELDARERERLVSELAAHLEDAFEARMAEGLPDEEAMRQTLESAANWRELRRGVRRAKAANRFNDRSRQIWMPSLVSLILANAVLMLFGTIALKPAPVTFQPLSWYPSVPLLLIYMRWIALQPLTGAIGAYLSYRAGGDRRARVIAGLFPSVVMCALWFGLIPISEIFVRNRFVLQHPFYFAAGAIGWILVPGMALFLGAMPVVWMPRMHGR